VKRALALADRLLAFLMRPRVRRIRRWSFLVTLSAGPLGEPVFVERLAIASDDPAALVAIALEPSAGAFAERPGPLGVGAAFDLSELAHHALHPA
jgi:hypothetical protein